MRFFSLIASIALGTQPAQSIAEPAAPPKRNIVQLAESVDSLSTLVAAVVAADLADTLSSPQGRFTVFAPTNQAFAKLPAGVLAELMKPENKEQLKSILTYHVLPELVPACDIPYFTAPRYLKTVEGSVVQVARFSRGIIRVSSVSDAGLVPRYVVSADNFASNGVVHIIDGVLQPPPAEGRNLVQLAESVGDLSTLVAAIVGADLADTLSARGPFTVFAPTNEAFAALPAGVFQQLMSPAGKLELIDILTYHVLPEKVLSTDLKPFQAVTTVEGKPLHVTLFGGRVRVGPSLEAKDLRNVVKADNLANNGVVHIIDGVLLPPALPLVEVLQKFARPQNLGHGLADLRFEHQASSWFVVALGVASLLAGSCIHRRQRHLAEPQLQSKHDLVVEEGGSLLHT